jgi:3-oxoacyl-[acyl-carrier-protein] synthase III
MEEQDKNPKKDIYFYHQPGVQMYEIPVRGGIPLGIELVSNPEVGIGGAYGAWGQSYDNKSLPLYLDSVLEEPISEDEILDLSPLGFNNRHHVPLLTDKEHLEVEVEAGARFLAGAANACGWDPQEVDAVLVGMSGPATDDYTEIIAKRAGIPENALKVSVHKACDGSVGGLHLLLNPELEEHRRLKRNIAEELHGKKVLVGGIEGLSRFIQRSRDTNALQLFGNGAGVIGVVPGETMEFLVGKTHEVYDKNGVLAVHMYYPHSGKSGAGQGMIEVSQIGGNHIRVAGLMHEPEDGSQPVEMAGPMGMVKLFVRTGVGVVREVYHSYQSLMDRLGMPDKKFAVTIVHHANYKINSLKDKHLRREGIRLSMPWVLSDFGNVSAASNMIAFLRELPKMRPGDHILIDGFGAGTYYDVLAVELKGQSS